MNTYPDDSSQSSQLDTHYDTTLDVNSDPYNTYEDQTYHWNHDHYDSNQDQSSVVGHPAEEMNY
ncbi:hypothetical protein PN466_19685 [Roseofilum reptotaenium CS-1145]|uniref:hypothetical protein n=1 Tax=Roseofilum reptotaenium TaxID=1233427 RepID=UPI000AD34F33|nr:hypothetical protein [Roseofilum reptotaenium]MDB9519170.1 hypothetical protein [Roseofilum reptotaenium CS-1145]